MGAWGYDLLENDAAGDLEGVWDDYVARGRRTDADYWTADEIWRFFRSTYFRSSEGFAFNDSELAAELLGLGALFQKHELPVPAPLKPLLESAASAELQDDKLEQWEEPTARKHALEAFLKSINGSRREVTVAPAPIEAEIANITEFSKQWRRWIEVVQAPADDSEFERLFPPVLNRLKDVIGRDARHHDHAIMQAAVKSRLMCLAFFTGWALQLPEPTIIDLIKAAERTEGKGPAFFFACINWDEL